ncbi:MAG: protease inhibitor I42 family protein [Anaerolineae bacterium]
MRRFIDSVQPIRVRVGEEFAVALAGNPTTGYIWQQTGAGTECVELVAQQFEPGRHAVGAGGLEVFHFRALQPGEARITFEHIRPWIGDPRDRKYFQVIVEPEG